VATYVYLLINAPSGFSDQQSTDLSDYIGVVGGVHGYAWVQPSAYIFYVYIYIYIYIHIDSSPIRVSSGASRDVACASPVCTWIRILGTLLRSIRHLRVCTSFPHGHRCEVPNGYSIKMNKQTINPAQTNEHQYTNTQTNELIN